MIPQAIIALAVRIIIAVIMAFYLYRDARSRDFNWTMWLVVPIFIVFIPKLVLSFIIAVGILLIYFYARPKGQLTHCPHCKHKIHSVLAYCPFCKKSVKRECLRCHETVDWDATTCPHCRSTQLTEF
jgi:RNA polymerase subunit RPABC4/transcription elongation factor Spt4